jgi:predicted nucleic acid-binding protein
VNVLLDTNVVSEWTKQQPDPGVVRWLATLDEDRAHLSVITLGELREGIDRMPPGRRREQLDAWLRAELPDRFAGRVVDIDISVAQRWGAIRAAGRRASRSLPVVDAFLAATALEHGYAIVTRNVADFAGVVPDLINPWTITRS